jgi:Leucine-rich repeat (LRR) protein
MKYKKRKTKKRGGINIGVFTCDDLESIDKLTYSNLQKYKILSLNACPNEDEDEEGLDELPDSIGKLTNLTECTISENKIEELPESIGNLTKLIKMDLSRNMLTNLPESIGNLTNLTQLTISENESITHLPKSIGNLVRLTNLDMSFNIMSRLPESIGNLVNLTKLDVSLNSLTHLPESIGNLVNLIELQIFGNKLTHLPESIGNLVNLINLNVSTNKLTHLPKNIGKLVHLVKLDISENNRLTNLPASLFKLRNFIRLYLSNLNILPVNIPSNFEIINTKTPHEVDLIQEDNNIAKFSKPRRNSFTQKSYGKKNSQTKKRPSSLNLKHHKEDRFGKLTNTMVAQAVPITHAVRIRKDNAFMYESPSQMAYQLPRNKPEVWDYEPDREQIPMGRTERIPRFARNHPPTRTTNFI